MRPKKKKDPDYQRLLAQERLILDATETIVGLLDEQRITRLELARRLGKTKGFVSRLLSGEQNMTLRTLADLGHALDRSFTLAIYPPTIRFAGPPRLLRAVPKLRDSEMPPDAHRHLPSATKDRSLISADAHEYALAV